MPQDYEDNIEAFTITFRREIVFYLRQLINDGERVTVMFDEGRENLLTVLIDVDEENDVLIFDWGGSASVNRKLLESKRAFFIANPLGVRNQFVTDHVWETSYKKRPAFATRIPQKFIRLQRREFFRLTLPIVQRRPCSFNIGEPPVKWDMTMVDIGLGGLALESQQPQLPFVVGQVLPSVLVDLGTHGKLEVDLEVRYVGTVSRGQKQAGRLGCHFVRLSHAQENEVQRFVTQIQREERAKLG